MKRGKRIMFTILVFIIIAVVVYWIIPYSPYKEKFDNYMKSRASKISISSEICIAEEIKQLPELLQKHCDYIGLEGFTKYQVVNTDFEHTNFVFDASKGKVMDMDYDLWLFYDKPYRSAYCTSRMYGVPFDGIDYCTEDKQGGMRGIVGKAVQIFDIRDKQGYIASLISWLAESAAINPSSFLSPYVKYEEVNDTQVKATITYNGVEGSGIFTFNETGVITKFESDERQVEEINGVKTFIGWRCDYEKYEEHNGIMVPSVVRSVKVYPNKKEVVYFEAENYKINYLK
ncbi:DUF6544 family protein [Clostridium sp.]|uniref:DUF6544 family protein n=1 Tax=Clostridium sp. TaxID=1506 RepID=UPI003F32790A